MSGNTQCDICGRIEDERAADYFTLDSDTDICICQSCNGYNSDKELRDMFDIHFVDDGTMDTVVFFRGEEYRFDNELRQAMDDDDFLSWARKDIMESVAQ